MGLGDEIMALGRAERYYESTGKPIAICNDLKQPRKHDAWEGHPAVKRYAHKHIIDGTGCRPYILHFRNRKAEFNMDHRPRAGRIVLTDEDRAGFHIKGPYAVIAPTIKSTASPNKSWGPHRWEKVIDKFPVPVYQLTERAGQKVIRGAIRMITPSYRNALAVIERAALVMCNEGGTHHMAASMRVPAVVVFGAFIPPEVTGYAFHHNIAVDTKEGFCGNWNPCHHCTKAMAKITPAMVRQKALMLLDAYDAD